MRTLIAFLLMASTVFGQKIVVKYGDSHYLVDLSKAEKVPVVVVGGKTEAPNPPTAGSLTEWVANRTKAIPAHRNKEAMEAGLSSLYLGLAKHHREGKLKTPAAVMAKRKEVFDTLVSTLGVGDKWKQFDADLIAELNRRKATDIPKALEEIAAGLSQNKFISPA